MSAAGKTRGTKPVVSNNVYTAFLAIAVCVVLATAALVAYKCYFQYNTLFKIPDKVTMTRGVR